MADFKLQHSLSKPESIPPETRELESSIDLESGRQSTLIERNEKEPAAGSSPNPSIIQTAQDWDGPDDPDNPVNWSLALRIYHTTIPAVILFTITFGSSVYTPGVSAISERFHVSTTVALLGLGLYVLGLGFGPVLAAPLSETFGRRIVYLIALPLGALFTLGAGLSQNFASLAICRFLAGFLGAPALAVGAGTNADIWPPVRRAIPSALFLWAPFAGPVMGPIIGGFAVENKGWRWTQWTILFFSLAVLLYSLPMRETYKKIILQKRAKRLGLPPSPRTGPRGLAMFKFFLVVTLLRPVHMIFTEPIVGFFSLYIGFIFSVLFGFFDAFPIVFEGVYGFNTGIAGLPWLGVLVGVTLSTVTLITIDRYYFRKQYNLSQKEGRGGVVAPEHRLPAAMLGSLGIPVGLFWFGWTSRDSVHWISPVLASIPFAWGNLCVFSSAALYLIDTYGALNGASAMAANGLVRYTLGGVFPLFTIQMYNRLGIAWATSLLGFLSLFMLPIPWVLFRYGSKIRAMSKYETIKA